MKTTLTNFFVFFVFASFAQLPYQSISAERVLTGIHQYGEMFRSEDQSRAGYYIDYNPIFSNVASVFSGNVWTSGVDNEGTVWASMQRYDGWQNQEYTAGTYDQGSNVFEGVWKVDGEDLRGFREDWADGQLDGIIPESILVWPAKGNPHIADPPQNDLAPFLDFDLDGLYDPQKGDFPIIGYDLRRIIPREMVFTVFHDRAIFRATAMEMQCIMYTLECDDSDGLMGRSVFTRHVITPKERDYNELQFGLWLDMDLGCYTDDYFGSHPEEDIMYGYNQDPEDGEIGFFCPQGVNTFAQDIPVQASQFLSHDMANYLVYFSTNVDASQAMHPPVSAEEIYHYLNGKWRDGTPLTQGAWGYNPGSIDTVFHSFPDDPLDTTGWSMRQLELGFSDNRIIGGIRLGSLDKGQSTTIDMVHFFTKEEGLNFVERVEFARQEGIVQKDRYHVLFENTCEQILSDDAVSLNQHKIDFRYDLHASEFWIENQNQEIKFEIIDFLGRRVMVGTVGIGEKKHLSPLDQGIYGIVLEDKKASQTEKVIKPY